MSEEKVVAAEAAEFIIEEVVEEVDALPPNSVEVNGQVFDLSHPKARQITGIVRAFARINLKARGAFSKLKNPTDMDYIMAFLSELGDDDLLEISALAIGADKQFVEDNFDLLWVTRALTILIGNSHLIEAIGNFTSMLSPTAGTPRQ